MKKLAIVLSSILVVACASTPKTESSQAPQPGAKSSISAVSTVSPATDPVSTADIELKMLADEIQSLQKLSDYFDYNKYVVKPEFKSVIQKEADFIITHRNDVVTLEGNADERGTVQYNIALGEKRSDAVRKTLEEYGVAANQIKIVSYGKGKPRLLCHEEKCWKENRRVDFVHKVS